MSTVRTILQRCTAYPVPSTEVETVCLRRGLQADDELTSAILDSAAFRLAQADIYTFLSGAPDVSQGGISYSLTDAQRAWFRSRASSVYGDAGTDADRNSGGYGYLGQDF